jgi:hypothetical protein
VYFKGFINPPVKAVNYFIYIFYRESYLFLSLYVFLNLVLVCILNKQPLLALLRAYINPEASVDSSIV